MDKHQLDEPIKIILKEISKRTIEAAQIAKAALACAEAGSVNEASTLSMDIEQVIFEAGRLQDAVSLLNRLSKESL